VRKPRAPSGDTLFARAASVDQATVPLAERMRPRSFDEFIGQTQVLGEGKLLRRALESDRPPSLILWGPPGVGKTSLGRMVAVRTKAHFEPFSAVLGSLSDLREQLRAAADRRAFHGQRTILFVDEIHRFHKGQQDAFLPHVEDGTIVMMGATTENPSFAVNAALLSRCKVFRFEALSEAQLVALLERALQDSERGLGRLGLSADVRALHALAQLAAGDARRALSALEGIAQDTKLRGETTITEHAVIAAEEYRPLLYDKSGDEHYAVTSALIKSMRGSDPDAAVYWMMRMIEAGDDPAFVLRRLIVFASEDVGNADPRALMVATAADQAYRRLGMPEGLYAIAQAVTYLAATPKSNAANLAFHRARALIEQHGALPVPKQLRPASTRLSKEMDHSAEYNYPSDHEAGNMSGESYLPEVLAGTPIYEPTERGEEARIRARLLSLRAQRSPK
jgi:putative ATPase